MHRLKPHLSYANVAATLALIIAVAGGTTALAGSKAAKNSVASSSIKPFNVTAGDLAGVRVVRLMADSARSRAVHGVSDSWAVEAVPSRRDFRSGSVTSGRQWLVRPAGRRTRHADGAYALCLKAKPGK